MVRTWIATVGMLAVAALPLLAQITTQPNGVILYANTADGQRNVYRVNPDGTDQRVVVANATDPAVSPDGRTIAFVRGGNLFVANADGTNARQVTNVAAGAMASHPSFTADGMRLVYQQTPAGENAQSSIRMIGVDGTHDCEVATNGSSPAISPDGTMIYFIRNNAIYSMNTGHMGGAPPHTPTVYYQPGLGVNLSHLSVSNQGVAFASTPVVPDGQPSILYLTAAGGAPRTLVQQGGMPALNMAGDMLAFVRGGNLLVMNVDGTGTRTVATGAVTAPVWWMPAPVDNVG